MMKTNSIKLNDINNIFIITKGNLEEINNIKSKEYKKYKYDDRNLFKFHLEFINKINKD
jgi:hypothetical protein